MTWSSVAAAKDVVPDVAVGELGCHVWLNASVAKCVPKAE